MNEAAIHQMLTDAISNLLHSQPNLFQFTSATNQTEWNIAHHLANEVHKLFPDYDCDLDVSKPNLGARRPDIVVHRRGTHEDNLVVVEVKRRRKDIDGDIGKIRRWWFAPPLHYCFGAVVVINEHEEPSIDVMRNE
jgi:hypothetical protein